MSAQWTERCAPCQGVGWRPTSSSTLDPEWQHCCSCGYAGVAWHVRPNAEQDAAEHQRRHDQ
jgi:hypothetical protein